MTILKRICALWAGSVLSASLSEEQRSRIKALLDDDAEWETQQRRLGARDEAALDLTRGLRKSLKAQALRKFGAGDEDGVPVPALGSVLLPEVHDAFQRLTDRIGHLQSKVTSETASETAAEAPVLQSNSSSRRLAGSLPACSMAEIHRYRTKLGAFYERDQVQDGMNCIGGEASIVRKELLGDKIGRKTIAPHCKVQDNNFLQGDVWAIMGYKCDTYPSVTHKCVKNTNSLPATVNCSLSVMLQKGLGLHLQLNFKIGFGGSGEASDLLAELSFGMWTDPFPEVCLGGSDAQSLLCEAIELVNDVLNTWADIGETAGGRMMKNAVKLYPLQLHYPGNRDKADGQKMSLLFRLPILETAFGAHKTSVKTTLSEGVCLSHFRSKTKFEGMGSLQKQLQVLNMGLGLIGSDLCFVFPNAKVDVNAGSLEFGMKLEGRILDQVNVSIDPLWEMFPSAFKIITEGDPNNNQDGLRGMFETKRSTLGDKSMKDILEEKLKNGLQKLGQPASNLDIDVAKLVFGTSLVKIDNMYQKKARRLEAPSSAKRRLATETLALPAMSFNNGSVKVTSKSQCQVSLTTMPKHLQCDLHLVAFNVTAHGRARAEINYDMDGTSYIVNMGWGVSLQLPTINDVSQNIKDFIAKFDEIVDIGALLDDDLAGTIKLLPGSFRLPRQIKDKAASMQQFARVTVDRLNQQPLCLSKLKQYAPHPAVEDMLEQLTSVQGMVGGDDCMNVTADLSDGFKLKFAKVLSIFDKDKFDIFGLLDMIQKLNPNYGMIVAAAKAILSDDLKKQINAKIAGVLPDKKMEFELDIGKELYKALSKQGGRRLAGSKVMKSDGTFDLGGIHCSAVGPISNNKSGLNCVEPPPPMTPDAGGSGSGTSLAARRTGDGWSVSVVMSMILMMVIYPGV